MDAQYTQYGRFKIRSFPFERIQKPCTNEGMHLMRITVKNMETGREIWFRYWTLRQPDAMTDRDHMEAFLSLLDDALLGAMGFAGFCKSCGCCTNDPNSLEWYGRCVDNMQKVSDLELAGPGGSFVEDVRNFRDGLWKYMDTGTM